MKKLFILMVVVLMSFSLTACDKEEKVEDTKMVCKTTLNGVEMSNEIVANGNNVKSIAYNNTMEVDESLAELLESIAVTYDESYNKIEGVTYTYEIKDGVFTEKTTIDFTKADFSELCDNDLLEKVDGKVPTAISLDKTIEGMKEIGCECK